MSAVRAHLCAFTLLQPKLTVKSGQKPHCTELAH